MNKFEQMGSVAPNPEPSKESQDPKKEEIRFMLAKARKKKSQLDEIAMDELRLLIKKSLEETQDVDELYDQVRQFVHDYAIIDFGPGRIELGTRGSQKEK